MTEEQKVEYANSYIEDMDIETKISVVENSLNLETLKDWLIEQCSEISDEDAYDIKCWAEEVCKYNVDDYIRENLYSLQNDLESVLNDYVYIPYDKVAYILSKLATDFLSLKNYD